MRADSHTPQRNPLAEETVRSVPPSSSQSQADSAEQALKRSIDALVKGRNSEPFSLLGPHPISGGWAIRFFLPWADEASISLNSPGGERPPMVTAKMVDAVKLRAEGFFEATFLSAQTTAPAPNSYKIHYRTHHGDEHEVYDTYAF